MSDEFRNRIKRGVIFIEPLLNVIKKGEAYQSDVFHCPYCKTNLSFSENLKESTYVNCYSCKQISRFIVWSQSDQERFSAQHYQASLSPVN